jgi:hypothetical protein
VSTAIATLERTRASINELIEAAAAEVEADRLERERQSAQAIEHANSAANTAAAYLQGREYAPKGADWDRAVERWRALAR